MYPQVYKALGSAVEKHNFISNYVRGGNGKDLSFVSSYTRLSSHIDGEKSGTSTEWLNRTARMKETMCRLDIKFRGALCDLLVCRIIDDPTEQQIAHCHAKLACANHTCCDVFQDADPRQERLRPIEALRGGASLALGGHPRAVRR